VSRGGIRLEIVSLKYLVRLVVCFRVITPFPFFGL